MRLPFTLIILAGLIWPALLQAQDITGLWTGYLSTTEKTLPYEVVISKKGGALTAYSHTTFTVNGKDIISVKRLTATYEMRHLILEDEDLLKNNFDKSAPKKISQTTELDLRMNGKQMILEGSFKTKRTRSLKAAEGVIILYKSADPLHAQARIHTDLQELKLEDALAVFKPVPPPADIALNEPVKQPETSTTPVVTPVAPASRPATAAATKPVVKQPVTTATAAVKPPVAVAPKPTETKPVTPAPVVAAVPPPPLPVLPKVDMGNRKIEIVDNITVFSDSLVLSVYDNGEVDGDTVSVLLNGKTIMSKQRLNTRANSITVYLTPDLGDSLQIIMYAENMGLYPPNTGLLIIQDGNRRREVRFSGDLNKNAAIILRRNKQ